VAENLLDTSELIALRRRGIEADGHTTILNLVEFPKAAELDQLNILYPDNVDYDRALILSAELLKRGQPVPAVDLVISAMAVRLGLRIITHDTHFKIIKRAARELRVQVKR
jgi:hypothetical protein